MNINELESLILTGTDDETIGMKYAQGYGRLLGFFWGVMERMSPEERLEIRRRLEKSAEFWAASQPKKVEETIT